MKGAENLNMQRLKQQKLTLRLIGCTSPHWTDSVEHVLTLEIETISDEDAAREQRGSLLDGSLLDGHLQAPPHCLQDCV